MEIQKKKWTLGQIYRSNLFLISVYKEKVSRVFWGNWAIFPAPLLVGVSLQGIDNFMAIFA